MATKKKKKPAASTRNGENATPRRASEVASELQEIADEIDIKRADLADAVGRYNDAIDSAPTETP